MKPNMNKTKVMIGGESSKRVQNTKICGICGRGEMLRGFLSGVRCRRFAYGPADATPSSLASLKSRLI